MIRLIENKEIGEIIIKAISRFPELRFNQILHNLEIVNPKGDTFYDEPKDVLKRIKETELYKKLIATSSYKGVF